MLRDLALGDDVFGLFGILQKCVISTPNGCSSTRRLPNLSRTHLLLISRSRKTISCTTVGLAENIIANIWWKECPLVYLRNVVGRAFSKVGIISRTWRRTWTFLVSCGRSKLKWGAPPFSKPIEVASILLGRVFFFQGGRHNSTTASQRLGRKTEWLKT